jgi:hypothetical protein
MENSKIETRILINSNGEQFIHMGDLGLWLLEGIEQIDSSYPDYEVRRAMIYEILKKLDLLWKSQPNK